MRNLHASKHWVLKRVFFSSRPILQHHAYFVPSYVITLLITELPSYESSTNTFHLGDTLGFKFMVTSILVLLYSVLFFHFCFCGRGKACPVQQTIAHEAPDEDIQCPLLPSATIWLRLVFFVASPFPTMNVFS